MLANAISTIPTGLMLSNTLHLVAPKPVLDAFVCPPHTGSLMASACLIKSTDRKQEGSIRGHYKAIVKYNSSGKPTRHSRQHLLAAGIAVQIIRPGAV